MNDEIGSSESLFVYLPKTLTKAERQRVEKFRGDLGVLDENLKVWRSHDD